MVLDTFFLGDLQFTVAVYPPLQYYVVALACCWHVNKFVLCFVHFISDILTDDDTQGPGPGILRCLSFSVGGACHCQRDGICQYTYTATGWKRTIRRAANYLRLL